MTGRVEERVSDMIRFFALLTAAFAILAATPSMARVRIDITQGNVDPMPIAAPNFLGADQSGSELGRDITSVVMSNLDRSGLSR